MEKDTAIEELQQRIEEASRAAVLLLAADYDGTLAPLVSDPATAEAHRESLVALRALAAMPQTHVAIISGRSLGDLGKHFKELERAHLVGSHGSEFEAGFAAPLPTEKLQLIERVEAETRRISAKTPGTMVERKPAAVAFHYRNANPQLPEEQVDELLGKLTNQSGIHIRHGKKVVELSVVDTDKGRALELLRQRVGATVVVFFGDDVTDEDAFVKLTGPDVGVKVGEGDTRAKFRVQTTVDVARLLASVAEKRSAWLTDASAVPIERHSMLSDQRTCALISPRGRVSWLCLPRIDSAAMFAELIGGPTAGFFEIRPASGKEMANQKYVGSSFVLQSDWGPLKVIDYLDCSGDRPFQRAGRSDLIRVIEGRGRVRITFAPRMHFGNLETDIHASSDGLIIEGSVDPCVLVAPGIHWEITKQGNHETAVAEFQMGDQPVVLELRYGTSSFNRAEISEHQRREQTAKFWSDWSGTLKLPSVRPDLVLRSALVLRGLCHGPSGAIAAAATTSLPESMGGVRNWDYRFCWPRDASMAAAALARLGDLSPALKLLQWILKILEGVERSFLLRPVYTVSGGHMGPEGIVADLAGYRGSRPVHVGNVAAHQVQLDVLGPVTDLISLVGQKGAFLTSEHWQIVEAMVAVVARRWREQDHGIWEVRGPRRHHVHSKVSCWHTVNSALKIARAQGHRRDEWAELCSTIAQDVLEHGWNEQRQAFCAYYGSSEIDAAALSVGLSGLLPPDDRRFASTVLAVERALRDGSTVYRYHYDDGLPGKEGGFNLCTAWLIEAYTMLGRQKDAEQLFEGYAGLAGPTGLLAEEYDPKTGLSLGNFPQAYSHIGLINSALLLAGASSRTYSS